MDSFSRRRIFRQLDYGIDDFLGFLVQMRVFLNEFQQPLIGGAFCGVS